MKPANNTMAGLGTTVFEVMSRLAMEYGSINLGQGFPDQDGPEDVRRIAADALLEGPNQYPPMTGLPELRQAIQAHARRFYSLDYDWRSEIVVTSGATEALADCFFGLLNPGDEVILLEPLYDSYPPIVERSGAVPRYVSLQPPEWSLPLAELEAAFGPKTKMILLNNPMNPASKVFRREELETIARLCIEHDVICLCDEVYEHLLFDGLQHIPIAGLPGMRERTLRIASAGKIFSLTGWKVGWIEGPAELMGVIAKTHQFITFTTPPNLQKAVAYGLAKDDSYFEGLAGGMQAKRDRLVAGLEKVGFDVLPSEGTYFVSADFRPLGFNGTDVEFCRHITVEAGVTAVPVSVFFRSAKVEDLARFCFSKQDAILDDASKKLSDHFGA
ncbi:MAG: aminotransferase [Rhodospirillaceae bacterium]|nr:aminotransferase [Rhodospirillaceae bacterium]